MHALTLTTPSSINKTHYSATLCVIKYVLILIRVKNIITQKYFRISPKQVLGTVMNYIRDGGSNLDERFQQIRIWISINTSKMLLTR